jgi:hypothetical protein
MLTRLKLKGTEKQMSEIRTDSTDTNRDINILIGSNEPPATQNPQPPAEENAKTIEQNQENKNVDIVTQSDNEAMDGIEMLCKILWDKANSKASKKLKLIPKVSASKKKEQVKKEIKVQKLKKKKDDGEPYKGMRTQVCQQQPQPPQPAQGMMYPQFYPQIMDYPSPMIYYPPMINPMDNRTSVPNLSTSSLSRPINFPKGAIHAAIAYHIFNKQKQEAGKEKKMNVK